MIAVKKHPSRKDAYADGKLALHPALHKEPWLYFNDNEYTRTDDGLVVPLFSGVKPKLLCNPAAATNTIRNNPTTKGDNK